MRQIRITSKRCIEAADNTMLICPVKSSKGYSYNCTDQCAWFAIKEKMEKTNEQSTELGLDFKAVWIKMAYCGDKLIGEIKEKADG